jgi:hypothetical protein
VDQDSLGNVVEVSWNGGLSSRDLRFAVWQRCESRSFAVAVAHDFFSGGVCFEIRLFFFFSWWMMEKLGKDAFSSRADDDYDGRK